MKGIIYLSDLQSEKLIFLAVPTQNACDLHKRLGILFLNEEIIPCFDCRQEKNNYGVHYYGESTIFES